jgi:peptidyl-prolyl cis-trans isomerase D
MAMLISKFHRMIQNKIIWYVICVIVVVLFVLWVGNVSILTAFTSLGRRGGGRHEPSAGTFGGRDVPVSEYNRAYSSIYLVTSLNLPPNMGITPEITERMKHAAWGRLASLRQAHQLGLTAADNEIDSEIQKISYFQTQGHFNNGIYRQFVAQVLPRFKFTEAGFEEHIRDEIVLRKMRDLLLRTYVVSPAELQRAFGMVSDAFKIEYTVLEPAAVSNAVKVTDADARQFFDKHAARFTQPEKARVQFVRFAITPFIPKVKVEPEAVEAYYNDNLDEFESDASMTGLTAAATNAPPAPTGAVAAVTGAEAVASATGTAAGAASTNGALAGRYKPFESVKQEIVNKLIHREATDLAEKEVDKLTRLVVPDRDGKCLTLAQAAAHPEFGLLVEEPKPFAEYEDVPGVDAGLSFNRAAFRCTMDPDNRVSEPVRGSNYIYLVSLEARIPERVPTFEEVKDEVRPYAERNAIGEALVRRAEEVKKAAEAALAASNTFASALAPFGLKAIPTEEFTGAIGPTTNDYSSKLMRGILPLNQGEVSEPIPADNEILLAHVIQRKPGDPTTFVSMRSDIEQAIHRRSFAWVYENWQSQLLQDGGYKTNELDATESEADATAEAATTNASAAVTNAPPAPTNAPPAVTPH